jgi:hypothetical protein
MWPPQRDSRMSEDQSSAGTVKECVCPQCGAMLREIKQKLICPRCGIVEGCCEGGRQ